MSIVSLFQIFSVTAEELEAVLGINLIRSISFITISRSISKFNLTNSLLIGISLFGFFKGDKFERNLWYFSNIRNCECVLPQGYEEVTKCYLYYLLRC